LSYMDKTTAHLETTLGAIIEILHPGLHFWGALIFGGIGIILAFIQVTGYEGVFKYRERRKKRENLSLSFRRARQQAGKAL
jgi:prolipoprotein diacylglyceryltransferase